MRTHAVSNFDELMNKEQSEPKANSELLSQLAQIGTNDGLINLQCSMQKLVSSLQSNQALQASALVGRKVLVASNKLQWTNKDDLKIGIDVLEDLVKLRAFIYSPSGELIQSISLGDPGPGFMQFSWDAKGQSIGVYKVEVRGICGGKEITLKTLTSANVDSVSLGHNGEGLKLNVSSVGSVFLHEVRQVLV